MWWLPATNAKGTSTNIPKRFVPWQPRQAPKAPSRIQQFEAFAFSYILPRRFTPQVVSNPRGVGDGLAWPLTARTGSLAAFGGWRSALHSSDSWATFVSAGGDNPRVKPSCSFHPHSRLGTIRMPHALRERVPAELGFSASQRENEQYNVLIS